MSVVRRALAAALMACLLAAGAAAQPAAPSAATPPAGSEAGTAGPEADLDDLIATLEDPTTRDALIAKLKALRANAAPAPDRTIFVDMLAFVDAAVEARVRTVGDAIVDMVGSVSEVPVLLTWVWRQLSDPIIRALWWSVLAQIGVAALAGFLASLLVRLPLRGWRDRLAELPLAARTRHKVRASLANLLVNLVALLVFLGVTRAVLAMGETTPLARLVAGDVLTAIGCVRALTAVSRAILAPENGRRRLPAMDDAMAQQLHGWLAWVLGLGIYGHFALLAAYRLGLPWTVHGFLSHVLFLGVTLLIIVEIYHLRGQVAALVEHWGRTSKSIVARYLPWQALTAIGHHILAFWVAAVFLVWAVGAPGGAALLTRGFLVSLAAMLGLRVFHVWLDRALLPQPAAAGEESGEPETEARPASRVAIVASLRAAAALLALAVVLAAWGIDVLGYLRTDTGREIMASVGRIGIVVLVVALVSRAIQAASARYVEGTGEGGQPIYSNRLRTVVSIVRNVALMLLVTGGIIEILAEIGVNANALLAGAGVVGLALGFGSQKLVQDLTTGMFILLGDTVRVGDVVDLGGKSGVVEAISMRTITLRAYNGDVHTIPYSSIDVVTNMTKDYSYYVFDVPIAYKEDVDRVVEVLKGIDTQLRREWPYRRLMLEPLEIAGVDAFRESAVVVKARTKVRAGEQWKVGREFNRRIKRSFDELGIEIPFPHHTVFFGGDRHKAAASVERVLHEVANPSASPRQAAGER